jgi:EmrB/QacA subfamily drug resistance transporter
MLKGFRAKPLPIFLSLAVAVATYAISQTMLVPALPEIEEQFQTTPSGVTTLMTSFWVSGAVTAILFGRLGDMFGKRRLLVMSLLLFSMGAAACALAPSLALMIAGRVLMGCAVAVFPLAYALIRDELPAKRVVPAIAVLGGLAATGAVVGQSTGGLVSDHFGYEWIFWITLVMGLVSVATVLIFVPESPVRTGGSVDLVGAALLAFGLAAPLIAIAETPSWGWTGTFTLCLFLLGAVLLAAFVAYEQRHPAPLIDIPTLVLPTIRLTNITTVLVGFGLFGMTTILSQFFQEPTSTGYGPGANATQAGLFLVPGLILLAISSPLAGRLSSRFGPIFTLRLGILIGTIGMAGMTLSHTHRFEMYLWPAIIYVGVGAAFGAIPTIVLQSVSPERSGQSSAINVVIRSAGSAIGIQLAATIITTSETSFGIPTDHGYTTAFALATIISIVAFLSSLAIPRHDRPGQTSTARPSHDRLRTSEGSLTTHR